MRRIIRLQLLRTDGLECIVLLGSRDILSPKLASGYLVQAADAAEVADAADSGWCDWSAVAGGDGSSRADRMTNQRILHNPRAVIVSPRRHLVIPNFQLEQLANKFKTV